MSQTDIYKDNTNRHAQSAEPVKPKRYRRRSSSKRRFDQKDHSKSMRRSKNTGARRLKHIWKKPRVQKRVMWLLAILGILFISFVVVWEFWYQDFKAFKILKQEEEQRNQRKSAHEAVVDDAPAAVAPRSE